MKKILIAALIFSTAGASLFALNRAGALNRAHDRAQKIVSTNLARQLAETQAEIADLTERNRDLKNELDTLGTPMDPLLVDLLLTNDLKSPSPALQGKILKEFRNTENPSSRYLVISKAILEKSMMSPLKTTPNSAKLTDKVCGVLAITPEERQAAEAAFTESLLTAAAWARANMKREGTEGDMLARYTIPTDRAFAQQLSNRLTASLNGAVGAERTSLLTRYFEYDRYSSDGAIADRDNVLSLHQISKEPGWGQRSGWRWKNGSEAINTNPEPIKPNRFPVAFRAIFPGGWPDVFRHENLAVPDFLKNPK